MRVAIIFAIIGLAAAAPQKAPRTIIDTLGELEQTTILDLIELAGLTDALNGEGPFTAFVPKQEVLDNLPQEILDQLLGDPELLAKGLTYHVAAGSFLSSDLADDITLPTVQGTPLRVNVYDVEGMTIATVAGVPIDLNSVDIDAGNGVIHLLDFIILDVPDNNTPDTLAALTADEEVPLSFEALLYAAEALGLIEQGAEADGFTVLAPLDSDAFNVEIVDSLLADPDALTAILLDHVYDTTIFSIGIGLSREFVSLGGNTLVVTFTDDRGYIVTDTDGNELADVVAGDIITTQGVVHVLDRPIIVG
jgi:transforming growth factor-beta-induced protein